MITEIFNIWTEESQAREWKWKCD